jgi:succinate dehydrogenase / fumarate reductase iron-sulfur subunit
MAADGKHTGEKIMNLTLVVWRQKNNKSEGHFETYPAKGISSEQSFLEMLDVVNEDLIAGGKEPIAFDHDCREGICGMCSLMINGEAHGPQRGTTTCQLHMRHFKDGDEIVIEPWRASAFPVVRDLVVDRSSFDRIQQAGGYVSVNVGGAPDANSVPIPKKEADLAMDAAACIGCGACVAACPNASAMLYVGAKVSQFRHLPQGAPEKAQRALNMITRADEQGFGACRNHFECEAACPKEIPRRVMAELFHDYAAAAITRED